MRRVLLQLCAVMLAAFVFSASALTASRSEFTAFMDLATGAGNHTVGFGTGGVPLVTTGSGGATGVGNMNFSHAAGGWPKATGSAQLPSPLYGKSVPVTGSQAFTKASVGGALARFAKKVGPIATGLAIYDLLNELGVVPTWNATAGENDFVRTSSFTLYRFTGNSCGLPGNGTVIGPTDEASAVAACQAQWQIGRPSGTCFKTGGDNTFLSVRCNNPGVGNFDYTAAATGTGTSSTPLSELQLAAEIAAKSGWPAGSAIDRALADTINVTSATYGDAQRVGLETEGPATITPAETQVASSPKVTTSSDGSSLTETQKCDLYQAGGAGSSSLEWRCWTETTTTVPGKTTTTTVTTTNPDGTTSTATQAHTTASSTVTTTTTPTNPNAEKSASCGMPNTPACKIDESGTPTKAPDGVKLDEAAITAQANVNKTTISGTADKGMFSGYTDLFIVPPVVACEPVTLPLNVVGVSMSSVNVDACGVVSDVRAIMAWLWALAGFWVCMGWIREAV